MDTYKLYNIEDKVFSTLPIEERIDILKIKNESDYNSYCGKKIAPTWTYFFFSGEEDNEVMSILNKRDKAEFLKKQKEIPKPKKIELNIPLCIQEDFKHFNIDCVCKNYKQQDRLTKLEKYNIDLVLNYDYDTMRNLVFTEKLYNYFIRNNEIINIEFYEFLLFNNIITYNIEEYFMGDTEDINTEKIKVYFTETFRPYFYKKYKAILKEINLDDDSKLKIFDFFYRKINVNIYKKKRKS
eukprot:SAG11_NODE_6164_length_1373_cov_2.051020_3_plen_240_part_00